MKKITVLILIVIIIFCDQVKGQVSFKINGTLDQVPKTKEIILVTQTSEIQDTIQISSNHFEFKGKVSEPTNAAIIVNGRMLEFPLVNDNIEIRIFNSDNKNFEIKYKNSQVNNNLQAYFKQESKSYIEKYKISNSKDSLAVNFIQQLADKYKNAPDKSGLSIILHDLTCLIGTKVRPTEIGEFFKLLPINEQNGFYGTEIKTYLEQSSKISLGQKINFDFIDINKNAYTINKFKGKLILLEFWVSWCGPCISQIPLLKQVSENKDKIQLISISIDDDFNKWRNKVLDLNMDWINIHYKQENIDLKKAFFITGVPYNILVSQDGEILRKNITMNDLLELLNL